MAESLFNFRFRLLPWDSCLHLNLAALNRTDLLGLAYTALDLAIKHVRGAPAP